MPKQTGTQKKVMEDVMHDYKHGKLKSGSGDKVKSRKQAIAIGMKESGSSNQESKSENKRNLRRTLAKKKRTSKAAASKKTTSRKTPKKSTAKRSTKARSRTTARKK